jgi:glycosyltransferase involved in cell wall biosynthesis
MKPVFSVIVPAYNEQEVLHESYKRLKSTMDGLNEPYELLFVNDGSRDDTQKILQELSSADQNVKVLQFSRNFGHQIAVTAGLDHASGQAIVIIDCDLQDPPEVVVQMVEKWREGYDVVYGKRKKREGESVFKKLSAFLFYRTLQSMSSQPIPLDTGDFRLIDRKVRDALCAMPEHNRFLRGMVSWVGFKQTPVEYHRDARWAGETKYPLSKMLKLAGDGITAFSVKPLGLSVALGAITCVLSLLFILVWLVLMWCGVYRMPGYAYGIAVLACLSGIIMLLLGIIGTYIGRIFDEAKGRPHYLLYQKINFSEDSIDDRPEK